MRISGTQQYCTFALAGLTFGIEVARVQEVIRSQPMTSVPLAHEVVRGLINLRGQIVTALDLRHRLGFEPRPAGDDPMNIIVRTASGELSLLVDEIGDVVEVDGSTLEPPPATVDGAARELIVGVYKLDGSLLLVLDTDEAVKLPAAL